MISLKCPVCGFFYSVGLPDDLTEEERKIAFECPCGATMEEVEFDLKYIPTIDCTRLEATP
jgi:hypothetical protein